MEPLRYVPFETVVDSTFWHLLAKRKLEEFCLDEGPFEISAEYSSNTSVGLNPRVNVDSTSLSESSVQKIPHPFIFKFTGQLKVMNSLDSFKSLEKQDFINTFGSEILRKCCSDLEFLKNPSMLLSILLLTYCDLKQHKFYFWFAYPAVLSDVQPTLLENIPIGNEFSPEQMTAFLGAYDIWRSHNSTYFFIVRLSGSDDVTVHSCFDLDLREDGVYLGFCDPATNDSYPGWPLRNMLYAMSATIIHKRQLLRVICFRERYTQGQRNYSRSRVLHLELTELSPSSLTQFVGWEKCDGALKPRIADLSASMNLVKLAESAVDLNLKLMKWRLVPDLKIDKFRNTRCLLIGAGTLGCNVARQLMAWGIKHITLIDNGMVSMSNPVRQSLFNFEDAKSGGQSKATAAARALTEIFPGVTAVGHNFSIPMPGHPISRNHMTRDVNLPKELIPDVTNATLRLSNAVFEAYHSCTLLNGLIESHDVVFLLTDTRESRWLPIILANSLGKLVINAALGFDTYLVMRHGVVTAGVSPSKVTNSTSIAGLATSALAVSPIGSCLPGSELGCYFCNDVVGPTDSTQNRSLDQQCTVTRPGVAMMAAAIAVELLISVLQHPLRHDAPALVNHESETHDAFFPESSFSLVPHQVRGFLSSYKTILPTTCAFRHCPACSQFVIDAFNVDGFRFLLNVFDDSAYLENICGLSELHSQTKENDVIVFSDSDDTQ